MADDVKHRVPGAVFGSLDPVTVEVDPYKMRIVLRNVIDRAVKNDPEGGKPVTVFVLQGQTHPNIVADERVVGIADSPMPLLFHPFNRTGSFRSRKPGGHGLGLSLVKSIVDAHKGQIAITSAVGRGTCVSVTLPALTSGPFYPNTHGCRYRQGLYRRGPLKLLRHHEITGSTFPCGFAGNISPVRRHVVLVHGTIHDFVG
jgi:hypothetical protein